jgi:non-homologous end joining protein Ku
MPANAPSRKSFTITIPIGLVNLTLDGYSGTEESATRRSTYIKATDAKGVESLHPVGMNSYDKVTGVNVSKSDCIKCVESADGTLVPVSDEEMQQFIADSGSCEFVGFITQAQYKKSYVEENLYQVRPTTKIGGKTVKGDSPYAKPFALFSEVMAKENAVGIVKFVQRGTVRFYGWHADGTLRSLRYDEEVRESKPMPTATFSDAELEMGTKLIAAKRLDEAPVLEDVTNTKIAEFVEAKAKAMADGTEIVLAAATEETVDAPNDDLMALLAGSL